MRLLAMSLSVWLAACAAPPRSGLEGRPQRHALSCESRAACDLLAFHGIAVDEDAFSARLPRSDNPDLGFVGELDGETGNLPPLSYGVHADPVAATLRTFGLDAHAVHGASLAWLEAELAAGRPVLLWGTSDLRPASPTAGVDSRGRAYEAVRGEHVFLAIASRRDRLVLLDPAQGREREEDKADVDACWASFRRAAVRAGGATLGRVAPRAGAEGAR